jgi:hypothetical protein
MNLTQNIGNWSAVIENDGKTPQLTVTGTFPTFGQKPVYHLLINEPQGINDSQLVLLLVYGTLVNPMGSVFFSVYESFVIENTEKYNSVLIIDANNRTIAEINVNNEKQNFIDESISFQPYLEVIKGIEIYRDKIQLRVPSNGLTNKESFKVIIDKGITGLPPFRLEIYRIKPDYGKALLPDGIVLEYTNEDLQEDNFSTYTLINQIG